MNSKERVLTAFHHGIPDRVPVDYQANAAIDRRLKEHFGLAPEDGEGLLRKLKVDFRMVGAPYRGPKLFPDLPERGIITGLFGERMCWIEHGAGGYWDFCEYPLADADIETAQSWPMPDPDDFDYSGVAEYCRRHREYALCVGDGGQADVINSNGRLRGMEQALIDLVTDDPAGRILTERRVAVQLAVLERTLEAAKGGADFLWIGEDLGTQIAPMISMETYRECLKPVHQRFIDLAKAYGLPVMVHSCGSSSWVYDEFIAMGVDVVDALQPEAADMAPACLKQRYGSRLAFHGCISTAGKLSFGTVEEVVAECRETLEIMMPGGGYCFAPTHMIQDNSPTENVLAMYEAAARYGVYSAR